MALLRNFTWSKQEAEGQERPAGTHHPFHKHPYHQSEIGSDT